MKMIAEPKGIPITNDVAGIAILVLLGKVQFL